jgi:hypothetical protein
MNGTTSCYVRVRDEQIRKELWKYLIEEIGYISVDEPNHEYILAEGMYVFSCNKKPMEIPNKLVNCNENIDMFKALSAMNNENDREQWYIVEKKLFNKYDFSSHTMFEVDKFHSLVKSNGNGDPCGRKATAEEIIKQYKNC